MLNPGIKIVSSSGFGQTVAKEDDWIVDQIQPGLLGPIQVRCLRAAHAGLDSSDTILRLNWVVEPLNYDYSLLGIIVEHCGTV